MPGRPRSPGARSDTSEADMEGLVEAELMKLKRQYRIMEGNRSAYTRVSQDSIRRQKEEMERLEAEKAEFLKELKLSDSVLNQNMDEENIDMLNALSTVKSERENEMKQERKRISELDTKILELERKVRERHRSMGGVHNSSHHTMKTTKKVRTLNNRLDQANQKFNVCLTKNNHMRADIEDLRIERQRFSNLNKGLQKQLVKLRQQIGEAIEISSNAYDARDEAQAKMILLKEKADKDIQQHNTEMKELIRIIDHDRKLKKFMGVKGQERREDPQLVAWRQKKEAREAERKKASQEDSVETYEAAFDAIKELTGQNEDLDYLVQHFIGIEEMNFALFNYVNEQNNQNEQLQDEIQVIHDDIDRFQAEGVELEGQRTEIMRNLEKRQVEASSSADKDEEQHKEVSKILDQLRTGIESLFSKINCDRSAITDMLGAATGVTDSNMIQYLGIIEQRTNELLAVDTYLSTKDMEQYEQVKTISLLGEGPHAPQPTFPVIPPSVGDEFESEASEASDDENRPYTRNELESKVIKTVKKRESAAKRDGFKYDLSNAREKTQKKDKKDQKK